MNLSELKVNESGYVKNINLFGKELKRMLELGFVLNTKITVNCIAPNKKTYLISIRGYLLALNIDLCKHILIERCE